MLSFRSLAVALCATYASCQSLTDVLGSQSDLSQLATLLTENDLLSSIPSPAGGLTLLAPTNDALEELLDSDDAPDVSNQQALASLINYHLINGTITSDQIPSGALGAIAPTFLTNDNLVLLNGAPQVVNIVSGEDGVVVYSGGRAESEIEEADIMFDGGVIHKIGSALTIPVSPAATASEVDNLSTLVDALMTADLVDTINTTPNVTIFAPSNDAFEDVDVGSLSTMQLTNILQYHVIAMSQVIYASTLQTLIEASDNSNTVTVPSLNGADLTFTMSNGNLLVNDMAITQPDILVQNGVVHVIGGVLMPSMASSSASMSMSMSMTATSSPTMSASMTTSGSMSTSTSGGDSDSEEDDGDNLPGVTDDGNAAGAVMREMGIMVVAAGAVGAALVL